MPVGDECVHAPATRWPRRCPSLGALAAAAAVAHWTHVGDGLGAWAAPLSVPAWLLLLRAAGRHTSARALAQLLARWPLPVAHPLKGDEDEDEDDEDEDVHAGVRDLDHRAHLAQATARLCLVVLETAQPMPAHIDLGDRVLGVSELAQLARARQRSGPPVTLTISALVSPATAGLVRQLWAPPEEEGSSVRVLLAGAYLEALPASLASEAMQALVRQGPLVALRLLVLDRCQIDADPLRTLVATPQAQALQALHLLYTEPPAALPWAAVLAALPALTTVCLRQSTVLSAAVVAQLVDLLGAVERLPYVHILDINVGTIPAALRPQVAAAIDAVATAKGKHLRVLRVGGLPLALEDGRHGADRRMLGTLSRTAPTLTTLALVACRLSAASFAADVAPVLAGLPNLRHLDLSGNPLLLTDQDGRGLETEAAAKQADQRRHLHRFLDALAMAVGPERPRRPLRTLTLRYVSFNATVLHCLLDRWLAMAPDAESVHLSRTWLLDDHAQPWPQSLHSVIQALQARIPPQYPFRLALYIQ
jgi:hypothetical protein